MIVNIEYLSMSHIIPANSEDINLKNELCHAGRLHSCRPAGKKRSFLLGWRLAQHVQQPRSNNWQSTSVWSMDSNVSEEMSTGKMINVEGHRIKHNKTSLSNVVSTFHKQDGDSLCTSLCIEMIQVLPAHRYPLVVTGMSH